MLSVSVSVSAVPAPVRGARLFGGLLYDSLMVRQEELEGDPVTPKRPSLALASEIVGAVYALKAKTHRRGEPAPLVWESKVERRLWLRAVRFLLRDNHELCFFRVGGGGWGCPSRV